MHDCEPYGHLCVGVAPMQPAKLARLVGITPKECVTLLAELEEALIFSRTDAGVIFSRRMVRDEDLRERRANGGQGGAEHGIKGAAHGAKGGRPKASKGGLETPLGDTKEPPPAFASASAVTPPIPPEGGKKAAIGLKAWIAAERAAGRPLLDEDDPAFVYAESVGIPADYVLLAWAEFQHRYCLPDAKRYRDWRAVFRKAVRGNWQKLWWLDTSGEYRLTTVGEQARRAADRDAA